MIQAKFYFEETPGRSGKLEVGVHSGVQFLGLVKSEDYYDIRFGSKGSFIHKRLFRPTGSNPQDGETVAEAITREIDRNLKHVVRMMDIVLGDEVVSGFEAPDYDSFMAKAAEALNANKGYLVNLKVIPDRNNKWPDLGYYPSYVEKHVPGEEPSLKFSAKELERLEQYKQAQAASDGADTMPGMGRIS